MTEQTIELTNLRDRADFLSNHVTPTYNQRAAVQYTGRTLQLLLDKIDALEKRIAELEKDNP